MIERSLSTQLIRQRQQRYDQCSAVDVTALDGACAGVGAGATNSTGQGLGVDIEDIESAWLDRFGEGGNVWSEYTLYRLTLGMSCSYT